MPSAEFGQMEFTDGTWQDCVVVDGEFPCTIEAVRAVAQLWARDERAFWAVMDLIEAFLGEDKGMRA